MIRTALYRVPKLSSRRGLPSKPAFLFSSPASRFDEKLASILASYSFEAYNEAFVGKPAKIADGSKVFFTSLQHIRKIFTGAMIVTIKNVKLTKFKPKNSQIAERIISGSKADPYVVATVINGYTELYNENQLSGTSTVDDDSFSRFCSSENQVLDRCRSTTKRNSNDAVWNGLNGRIGESYALYFQDNRAASMTFTVFDEEVFSGDILIGNALLSNQELEKLVNYSLDSDASEFDLPIFQSFENEAGTLIQSLKSLVPGSIINPRSQIGSLGISVKYMPWSSLSDEQICSLVVLGDTEFAFSNAIVNNVKEDWMKTFWKNKPSEWSNMLNTAAQNQLPSIPMPSDVFNPAEGTLLNHASSALQQLQFKFAQPRNVGDDTSANSTGESMKNIVTLDKNEMFQSAFLPRGATPDVANWTLLLQHLLQNKECEPNVFSSDAERKIWESLENGTMCQIAAIDNPETDTQAAIWADSAARSLIISFRGTELTRIKDILTDINVFQTSFLPNHPNLANVQFHEGFLTAYSSVQLSLLQHLYDIFSTPSSSKYRNWTIFITGHSLGGALATVCAFDLGRIRAGMVASATPPKWYHSLFSSGNGIISEKHRILLEGLQASELVVYTYGAPRVGDLQFKQLFDRWIPNCFRVVNGHDIIARMPRNVSLPFAVDPPAILNHKSKETQM
jgi:predicted lipase